MPGKPFYSMDEVCAKLGKSQDEVKALVRGGTLREFRDAGRIFFKADDIDKLAKRGAGPAPTGEDSGEILLEPVSDSGKEAGKPESDLAKLSDSAAGGTSIIGLEPLPEEEEEKKEDTAITAKGVGVFEEDEIEADTDPMAKTQITTGASDQVSLEGAGSGSGLLDLAREADDTALGADLLDEIYPGEEEGATATAEAERPAAEAAAVEKEKSGEHEKAVEEEAPLEEPEEIEELIAPAAAAGDAAEGMFSGLLVGALILMAVSATVVAGVVQGYLPDYARFLGDGSKFYFFLGGAVLLPVIALVVGWFVGKALMPRRRA
jgi:hypothetical protein